MSTVAEIRQLLQQCTPEERLAIFQYLRDEFPIHPFEKKLNAKAEVILEAFSRASDLTLRGIRGIIAEAAFVIDVVSKLEGWKDIAAPGNHSYDCLLSDGTLSVRVQIKLQRLKGGKPMMASEGYRNLPKDMYVVETQKTRGGKDANGENTRPYRFGEFDILGVNMHPSTNNWHDFMYTLSSWLLPETANANLIQKFQPVSRVENECWTKSFLTAVDWLRQGVQKRIL